MKKIIILLICLVSSIAGAVDICISMANGMGVNLYYETSYWFPPSGSAEYCEVDWQGGDLHPGDVFTVCIPVSSTGGGYMQTTYKDDESNQYTNDLSLPTSLTSNQPFNITLGGTPCMTNLVVLLNDTATNGIAVSVYGIDGNLLASPNFAGPLSNYPYSVGSVGCSNAPGYAMYSNTVPACMEPWTATLNDNWAYVWTADAYAADGSHLRQYSQSGGVTNFQWLVTSSIACTNLPGYILYSNYPPCMEPVVFNVINTAPVWRIMGVCNNASTVQPPQVLAQTLVAPTNGVFYYSNSVPCGAAQNYSLWASGADGDDNVVNTGITPQGSGSNSTNSVAGITPNQNPGSGNPSGNPGDGGGTPNVTNTVPPVVTSPTNSFLPPVNPVTNSVIYSNTNQNLAGLPGDVQQSGQAVYGAVNTAANQAHNDAANAASQAHSDATNAMSDNQNDANGIISAINAFHADNNANLHTLQGQVGTAAGIAHSDSGGVIAAVSNLTNWLGQSVGTNTINTNVSGLLIPGTGTNGDLATAAATSMFGTPIGYLSDTITELTTPPDIGDDPGHSVAWEMNFCNTPINLDPVQMFPTAFTFSYGLMKWLMVAMYIYYVGKMYMQIVGLLASTHTGGVPNLIIDVLGTGGNALGVTLASIIPAVFLLLWFVVVSVCVVPLDTFLGLYGALSAVFSSVEGTTSGAMATHVLKNAFPISTGVGLLTGYLLLQFTAAKATLIACAASRYLLGR